MCVCFIYYNTSELSNRKFDLFTYLFLCLWIALKPTLRLRWRHFICSNDINHSCCSLCYIVWIVSRVLVNSLYYRTNLFHICNYFWFIKGFKMPSMQRIAVSQFCNIVYVYTQLMHIGALMNFCHMVAPDLNACTEAAEDRPRPCSACLHRMCMWGGSSSWLVYII